MAPECDRDYALLIFIYGTFPPVVSLHILPTWTSDKIWTRCPLDDLIKKFVKSISMVDIWGKCRQINSTRFYWCYVNKGQILAWCHHAKSHYMSQYLLGPTKSPLGVTSLWGIKSLLKILLASAAGLAFNYILIAVNFIRSNSHDICMKCSIGALYYASELTPHFSQNHPLSFIQVWSIPTSTDCARHDVIKWNHFPRHWNLCVGNSPMADELSTQRPGTRSFDFVLWSAQE